MASIELAPLTTALVLIDLQRGIMGMPMAPHAAADLLARSARLAAALRAQGGTIAYVRVDVNDARNPITDLPSRDPNAPPAPASASEIVPESGYQPGDLLIIKRSWGAFYGTELDQQLRRREIRTILFVGVATNIGVESSARDAYDRGYELVFVADALSSRSAEMHNFPIQHIFPRMGRVRSTDEVLEALAESSIPVATSHR